MLQRTRPLKLDTVRKHSRPTWWSRCRSRGQATPPSPARTRTSIHASLTGENDLPSRSLAGPHHATTHTHKYCTIGKKRHDATNGLKTIPQHSRTASYDCRKKTSLAERTLTSPCARTAPSRRSTSPTGLPPPPTPSRHTRATPETLSRQPYRP